MCARMACWCVSGSWAYHYACTSASFLLVHLCLHTVHAWCVQVWEHTCVSCAFLYVVWMHLHVCSLCICMHVCLHMLVHTHAFYIYICLHIYFITYTHLYMCTHICVYGHTSKIDMQLGWSKYGSALQNKSTCSCKFCFFYCLRLDMYLHMHIKAYKELRY